MSIEEIYDKPLISTRGGLFYNTYAYPTKISPESIAVYIATHTRPGDTVLDAFAGSGSTGLAALMCEKPTEYMIQLAERLSLNPVWGKRNAILYDISVYGTFAAKTMSDAPAANDFQRAAEELLEITQLQLGNIYEIKDQEGREGQIRHVIWSSVIRCPHCGAESTYYDTMVTHDPLKIKPIGKCPSCNANIKPEKEHFVIEQVEDELLKKAITRRKREPMLIYGSTNGKNWSRKANAKDVLTGSKHNCIDHSISYPIREINWGELHRSGYHEGITHLHHFYTERNFRVFASLWANVHKLKGYSEQVKNALKLWLLSYNETHSTLMTRVVVKNGAKDFVLTGSQSGVLYISNLPVEKNIFMGLHRKISSFVKAFDYLKGCHGNVTVHNLSSTNMVEQDNSIDYVFTDPPFGGFIPYSEINQINELWLGKITDSTEEAIINSAQHKSLNDYKHFISRAFEEMHRVLKPKSFATLVYHASKANVWNAFIESIRDAGFDICAATYLNKTQQSFKQVVSNTSVRNDSLMLITKSAKQNCIADQKKENKETVANNRQLSYTQYVNDMIIAGKSVELDASQAYKAYEAGAIDD